MSFQTGDQMIKNKEEDSNNIQSVDTAPSIGEEPAKPLADRNHVDTGLDAYLQALELDPERLEQISKRVLRKLDFILLPMMVAVCMTAYLEKASLNYANAFSMQKDLGLKGREYSWTVSIASLGMLIGAYPSSLAIQKFPLGKMMSILLFTWGLFSMSLAGAKNFGGIFTLRFLLGLSESTINPAWVILSSMFWTRDEQPLRMCIWLGCNGLADIIGAGLAVGLGSVTDTAIRAWQLIFLVIGSLAIILSVVCFFYLPSSPTTAWFLTEEERLVAVWRLARNQTGVKHTKVLKYQLYEVLRDFRVWCLIVQQFSAGMANGALAGYYSAFLKGFGWSSIQSVQYQLPIGAFQLVASIIAGYLASRFRNRTIIIILVLALFAIAGMVGFSTIPADQKMALTSCTWIVSVYGGAIILNYAVVAANFAGHTKRMAVNGIGFVSYFSGNFAGPFVFDPKEAPRYPSATKVLASMLGVGWVATAAMGIYMWNANRRRDAKAAAGNNAYDPLGGSIDGFTDHTDKENKSFRYRY